MINTQQAIQLTFVHEWLTVYEAELLLQDAYNRFRCYSKYGGNMVKTLLKIEYSIFLRETEEQVKDRLNKIKGA